MEFLGSLIYTIISSEKSDIFTSSFPICIPLISFYCRIALARNSNTILILPIHEHGKSFHLLRSSLISFFRDLKFLSYRSFTYLVRVTPRYFILFVTIEKGVVSLISSSACLSFVYRKAIDLFNFISSYFTEAVYQA